MLALAFLILQMIKKIVFFLDKLFDLGLQSFNFLFILLKTKLVDECIGLFLLMLWILDDRLRIGNGFVFLNDLLLDFVDFFVLGEGYLGLLLQLLDVFFVHHHE